MLSNRCSRRWRFEFVRLTIIGIGYFEIGIYSREFNDDEWMERIIVVLFLSNLMKSDYSHEWLLISIVLVRKHLQVISLAFSLNDHKKQEKRMIILQWIVMCSVWVWERQNKQQSFPLFLSLSVSREKEKRNKRKRTHEEQRKRERDTVWWKFIVSFVQEEYYTHTLSRTCAFYLIKSRGVTLNFFFSSCRNWLLPIAITGNNLASFLEKNDRVCHTRSSIKTDEDDIISCLRLNRTVYSDRPRLSLLNEIAWCCVHGRKTA